jgi:serine/threonine-protein phosphatase 2B catalytic subunit
MPLVTVMDMLSGILKICDEDETEDEKGLRACESLALAMVRSRARADLGQRREVIRNKIKAVGRMSRMFAVLREERETVVQLKGLFPNQQLPVGLLAQGREGLRHGTQLGAHMRTWKLIHFPHWQL